MNGGRLNINVVLIRPVGIDDQVTRFYLAVSESLPVSIISGMAFINHHIKAIVPLMRSIVPNQSAPAPILSTSTTSVTLGTIDLDDVACLANPSAYECLVRTTSPSTLAPWPEGTFRVRTGIPDLDLVTNCSIIPKAPILHVYFYAAPYLSTCALKTYTALFNFWT